MPIFTYKAINNLGKKVTGEITAESEQQAMELISLEGHIPESLKKRADILNKTGVFSTLEQLLSPVKTKEMILYTMQLKTLLQAGVPILQIFQILEQQVDNSRLRAVSVDLSHSIRQGSSLFDAFSKHNTVFSNLYLTLIKAGELSGSLPEVLERLIFIMEHEEKVRADIKAAVRYPAIVVVFLGVAFFILLTFVVPKFVTLFQGAGLELPLPTKICMFLYMALENYWMPGLLFIVISSIGLFQYINTENGKFIKDSLLMRIPLLGTLLIKTAMSRFASIFSILQSSGISVLESIKILAATIDNKAITKEFDKINTLLVEGRGIAVPLGKAKYFPSMVVNMVAIGEESGNLDDMLIEIAKHYDAEVEYATKGFSEALGPVLVVGLAAVVGFFAFAIFLPMWDLTKMVN